MNILKMEDIEARIIVIRGENVLLDADLAGIYGVATKEVNQAVANNPDKFPAGYILELTPEEKQELIKNFDRLQNLKFLATNSYPNSVAFQKSKSDRILV
jgi:hypothetical protein